MSDVILPVLILILFFVWADQKFTRVEKSLKEIKKALVIDPKTT